MALWAFTSLLIVLSAQQLAPGKDCSLSHPYQRTVLFLPAHTVLIPQEGLWSVICVCRSFSGIPLLLMLRWRSIVFVLYVNVYQRVPTVNASTYKVMYWHGRFLRDCSELSVYRGSAAEGRLGRRGNAAVIAWEEEAGLITHHYQKHNATFTLKTNVHINAQKCKRGRTYKCPQCTVWTWKAPDLSAMLMSLPSNTRPVSQSHGGIACEWELSEQQQTNKQKKTPLTQLFY